MKQKSAKKRNSCRFRFFTLHLEYQVTEWLFDFVFAGGEWRIEIDY